MEVRNSAAAGEQKTSDHRSTQNVRRTAPRFQLSQIFIVGVSELPSLKTENFIFSGLCRLGLGEHGQALIQSPKKGDTLSAGRPWPSERTAVSQKLLVAE